MQKISDLFIQNIKNFPIWVKQVITKEIFDDLNKKLEEFSELAEINDLFQYMCPKVTFKGKQELQEKTLGLSDGYYTFLQELLNENNIFEITIKNSWTLADSAKIFCRLCEMEYITVPDYLANKNVVFNIHGELLNLKYISIYDITSDLINLKTPCYIKNKKSEYIDKWKNDKNIHRLFTNPYLLFHFLVADILHDNYVETIKDSTLLENEGEMFWRLWEKAYLKKQLINKVKLVNKLDEMYNNFTNIYGSEFLK